MIESLLTLFSCPYLYDRADVVQKGLINVNNQEKYCGVDKIVGLP